MKKTSKILAVALVVVMLMMTSVTAFADYAVLPMNEWVEFSQYGCGSEVHQFIPETSGFYVVNAEPRFDEYTNEFISDPYVIVYDEYKEEIASADDSINGYYGCEVWFYAEEGETYYIEIGNYGPEDTLVEFDVFFEAETEGSHITCWDYDYDGYCDWCGFNYCDHNCHKDGIVGFFWSITNFFNRVFGLNSVCECGAYHW